MQNKDSRIANQIGGMTTGVYEVPTVEEVKVINKRVIYTDEIPSDLLGKSTIINEISDVKSDMVKKCIIDILESNKNVTFYLVQYLAKDDKLYFYTDQKLNKEKAEENKKIVLTKKSKFINNVFHEYTRPMFKLNNEEVNEEIKKNMNNCSDLATLKCIKECFSSEESNDPNQISLFNVKNSLIENENKINDLLLKYKTLMTEKLKKVYEEGYYLYPDWVRRMFYNYETRTLLINMNIGGLLYFDAIDCQIEKDKDNLKVSYHSYENKTYSDYFFNKGKNHFLEIIDFYEELEEYCTKSNEIETNSNFKVDIDYYGITVKVPTNNGYIEALCDRNTILKDITNKKINKLENMNVTYDDILKNIYVNINNCPIWLQDSLYEIRDFEIKQKKKEEKRQRRREFVRNIFQKK